MIRPSSWPSTRWCADGSTTCALCWPSTQILSVRRSAYGHRATLLHYTAANGVEIRRQVVPANAAEVVATLLDAGADQSARLRAYGGDFDVLEMFKTSAHPHDAGVAREVGRALAIS